MKTNFFKTTVLLAALAVLASCKDVDPEYVEKEEIKPFEPTGIVLSPLYFQCESGSADGKFAVGSNYETALGAIWNLETNTVSDIDGFFGSFHAISTTGLAVGEDTYAYMAQGTSGRNLYYNPDMEEVSYEWDGEVITDYSPAEVGSSAYCVSADGSVIGGFYFDASWTTFPCIWKAPFTGATDRITLPLPTDEEVGFTVNGAEVRWMSSDAKVLAGYIMDDMSTWPLVIWEMQADGSYKVKPVCAAYFHPDGENDAQYMFFQPTGMSANGEWVALSVAQPYDVMS